jgi:hypothetical protein
MWSLSSGASCFWVWLVKPYLFTVEHKYKEMVFSKQFTSLQSDDTTIQSCICKFEPPAAKILTRSCLCLQILPSPDRLCAFNLFGLQCSTPYWLENQPWIRSDYKIQFMKQIWLVQSLLERIQRDIHTADPWNFIWFRADNSISIDPEHALCLLEREAYSDLGLCWLWPW